MRLRNIPRAESVLEACKEVVKNPESLCGHWNQEFQNERPRHRTLFQRLITCR